MGEQYFEKRPSAKRRPEEFRVTLRGQALRFHTDAGVFSRGEVDRGTELLLQALEVGPGESILDLGCGYGVIGIVAARLSVRGHVVLTDVNERAASLARMNLVANNIGNAEVRLGDVYAPVASEAFHHIVCNPPIRAGRAVVDRIIADAPDHLLGGGSLWLVVRTRQGARALQARMADAFANATVIRRGSGFKVLRSVKRGA